MDQLEINLAKGQLTIKGSTYRKLVEPPSATTLLKATPADRGRWNKVRTIAGNVIRKEKCEFHGFSVVAGKIETIRDAYCKLKQMHGNARHIVCTYCLPGANWPLLQDYMDDDELLQDYMDDDEFNAGSYLLKMLTEAEIFNRAVFVVRYYGGEHLGPSRFQAFVEVAQSAITHDPYNSFSKCNQTPWPKAAKATPRTEVGIKLARAPSTVGGLGGKTDCQLSG